jgi:plasmid stabilization system protein ParE
MSTKRVEYHQGAISDVKSAVAWYRKRSAKAALNFIEELQRAADTICEAPERWPLAKNNTRRFLLWRFPFSIMRTERLTDRKQELRRLLVKISPPFSVAICGARRRLRHCVI